MIAYYLSMFLMTCVGYPSFTQHKAIFIDDSIETLFDINDHLNKAELGYYFPEYDYNKPTNSGYIIDQARIEIPLGVNIDSLNKDELYLNYQVYSQNVGQIKFLIITDSNTYILTQKIYYDGFQTPEEINLKRISHEVTQSVTKSSNSVLIIEYTGIHEESRPILHFRNLMILKKIEIEKDANVPFFNGITIQNNPLKHNSYNPKMANWIHIPEENNYNYLQGYIHLKRVGSDQSEFELFDNVVERSLFQYPFYDNKNVSKTDFLDQYRSIRQSVSEDSLCQFVTEVDSLVKTQLKDLHFYVRSGCGISKRRRFNDGGIKLYAIGTDVMIAASLDTINQKQFPVGSRILEIDERPVTEIINDLSEKLSQYYSEADSLALKNRVLKELIKPNVEGTLQVKIRKADDSAFTGNVDFGRRRLQIPSNFRPKHCEFKLLENSVAYFRINVWSSEVYTRLVNHLGDIKSSNGIIFDIRGNGGGDQFAAMQLISMFLTEPQAVYYYKPLYHIGADLDSMVIAPDQLYNIGQKKVGILIDNNSASGSELFVKTMKGLDNVKIIGSSKTRGSVSSRYILTFPSGIQLSCNSILNPPIYMDEEVESIGITPDIVVNFNSVFDLRPYEDKVLKEAINVIYNAL